MAKQQTLRTRRLFRDNNRALVIAMDHARVFDTITGLKDSNHIITNIQSNLGDMNVEVNTKLNKIDADIYTVQTEVHDTKMATEDIRAILLSYSDNKYIEKTPDTSPTQHSISWFKW